MRKPSALAALISVPPDAPLDERNYYLSLSDVLLDIAESRTSSSPVEAAGIAGYAHAFSHDVLNMAVMAASLLWGEDVTPDMSRSEDLVRLSADAENYLVLLQTACDIMADVIREFGLQSRRRGQVPKESFHKLQLWSRKNRSRLEPAFEMITRELSWFDEVNGLRTKIVHRGYHAIVYTNRIFFSLGLAPPDLTFGTPRSKTSLKPMLPLFSRLTFEMLNFSDELAAIIANQKNIVPSRRHILSGVYVPALHQLRAYGPPLASPSSRLAAQCLLQLGDYLAASKLGYPRGYTWVLLLRLSERLGLAERANGEGRFAPGAEAEAFFVFSLQHERVGVVLVEAISNRKNLVRIATEQMAAAGTIINRFIVVCRREHQNTSESDGSEDADLVVSDDPSTTASRILQLLNVATAPPQEERNNE